MPKNTEFNYFKDSKLNLNNLEIVEDYDKAPSNVWIDKYKAKYKDIKEIYFLIKEDILNNLSETEKNKLKDYMNEIYISKKFNTNLNPISSTEEVLYDINQNKLENLLELTNLINSSEYPILIFIKLEIIDEILKILSK